MALSGAVRHFSYTRNGGREREEFLICFFVPSTTKGEKLSYAEVMILGIFAQKQRTMIKYINWFLGTYGYGSIKELSLSVLPSFKYDLQVPSISLSVVVALLNQFLGITPAIAVAMLIAVTVEVKTGLKASKVQGIHFESVRFSRCVLKTFIWIAILYVIHSFYRELNVGSGWVNEFSAIFMNLLKVFVMVLFVIEHVTSILENLAIIEGKPKTAYVTKIQGLWDKFTNVLTGKIK